jgi:hypothetical protein
MNEGYKEDVFSTSVRAGKRTYFFDVKATRGNDLFMTITESKRVGHENDGPVHYEKHKIFLYKEDFDGFAEGLQKAIDHIRNLQGTGEYRSADSNRKLGREFSEHSSADELSSNADGFSNNADFDFDDLGKDH